MIRYFIFGITASLLISPIFTSAEAVDDFYSAQNQYTITDTMSALDISMTPQYPEAGNEVSIRLNGYANDLDRSTISYFINGTKSAEGIGQKSFAFRVGSAGELTRVLIRVSLPTGFSYEKTITINPVKISIAWEASTYVPPFYEGKALYSDQSRVKFVAYTNGKLLDGSPILSTQTIYTWKKNNRTAQDFSGIGKNVLEMEDDPSLLGEMQILVGIESFDKSVNSQKTISLPSVDPFIAFYENDPSAGLATDQLKSRYELNKDTVTIALIPFFLSLESLGDSLAEYEWTMNQNITSNKGPFLVIQKPKERGYTSISVSAESKGKLFQRAKKDITITFNNE